MLKLSFKGKKQLVFLPTVGEETIVKAAGVGKVEELNLTTLRKKKLLTCRQHGRRTLDCGFGW